MPYIGGLPLEEIGEMMRRLIVEQGETALQYGSGQGHEGLREHITHVMALEGIRAHPDDVVVTTGSQQALDLVISVLIDPGIIIVAEGPPDLGTSPTISSPGSMKTVVT